MDRLQAMKTFVAVAHEASFAAAARKLNLSPAAATRAVAQLEEGIGARLFIRTTRKVSLTEAGARYLLDCERILAMVDEAEAGAGGLHAVPAGKLTVTAPVLFGQFYIAPIITEFLDQYDQVEAQLTLLDRVTNLVDEGMDVAIRIGKLSDSSQAAIRVGAVRRVVCASPAYLKKNGVPAKPEDLARHNILSARNIRPLGEWRFRENGRDKFVNLKPRLNCNSNAAVIAMAEQGWGLTQLLSYQLGPSVAAGRLRLVLENYEQEALPVHVVHTEGLRASAKVRAFVDFAAERLRADPLVNPR